MRACPFPPASCASRASQRQRGNWPTQNGLCERGHLTTALVAPQHAGWRSSLACDRPITPGSGNNELAFLGDQLEGLARALDAILAVVTLGRKLSDHLIGTGRGRTRYIAGSKVDGRSNRKLVLQRPLHHAKRRSAPTVPHGYRPAGNPGRLIARAIAHWPATSEHGKCAFFQFFRAI